MSPSFFSATKKGHGEIEMKKVMIRVGAIAFTALMTGCSMLEPAKLSPEEQRAKYQEEFTQFAALPPAKMVASPDPDITKCARLTCDLFNEMHPLMKAYVAKVESSREYTAFMNEVRYCVEEEKLSNQDACKKVYDAVIAADANRPDGEKLWPKIHQGIIAANELDPKKQTAQILVLIARNKDVVKSAQELPKKFSKEKDFRIKAQRASECAAVLKQAMDCLVCLNYLSDQYSRVVELENYAR